MLPFQYSDLEVLGVPPPIVLLAKEETLRCSQELLINVKAARDNKLFN